MVIFGVKPHLFYCLCFCTEPKESYIIVGIIMTWLLFPFEHEETECFKLCQGGLWCLFNVVNSVGSEWYPEMETITVIQILRLENTVFWSKSHKERHKIYFRSRSIFPRKSLGSGLVKFIFKSRRQKQVYKEETQKIS